MPYDMPQMQIYNYPIWCATDADKLHHMINVLKTQINYALWHATDADIQLSY